MSSRVRAMSDQGGTRHGVERGGKLRVSDQTALARSERGSCPHSVRIVSAFCPHRFGHLSERSVTTEQDRTGQDRKVHPKENIHSITRAAETRNIWKLRVSCGGAMPGRRAPHILRARSHCSRDRAVRLLTRPCGPWHDAPSSVRAPLWRRDARCSRTSRDRPEGVRRGCLVCVDRAPKSQIGATSRQDRVRCRHDRRR